MKVIRTVFIDLESVLVDYIGAVCRLAGANRSDVAREMNESGIGRSEIHHVLGVSLDELHRMVCDARLDFWSKMDGADYCWRMFKEIDTVYGARVVIYPHGPMRDVVGMLTCMEGIFGGGFDKYVVGEKRVLAQDGHVLVDDSVADCLEFSKRGNAVLFHSNECRYDMFEGDRVRYVMSRLKQEEEEG